VVVTLLVGVAGWAWAVPAGPAAASAESAAAAPKADAASNDAPAKNGTATEASARPGDDPAAQRKAREDAARQQREFARTRYTVTSGKPKMSFESIAIKDVLNYLASIGKFSIVFDQALDEANIDLSTRTVTLKASGMTYEDAINLILPRECGYRIGPGYVLITTLEKSYLPLRTGIYSIQLALAQVPDFTDAPRFEVSAVTQAATAAAGSGGGGGFGNIFGGAKAAVEEDTSRATPEKIIDLVKKFVKNSNDRRIAPWDDEGGPATIQYLGGKLVVSQTDYGHRAVAKFLASVE
jgi:hypothetical protein